VLQINIASAGSDWSDLPRLTHNLQRIAVDARFTRCGTLGEAPVVRDFLFSVALTAAFIGIPTLAHWIWTGRRRPLDASYHRVLLYIVRWFGTVYAAVAAMLFVIASADMLLDWGFGYPARSLLLCIAMIAVGLIIRWMAGLWLARPHG
jgi:hypothetical protein